MLGIARKAEAARHDRHAVEKDAGKRRLGIRKYLALGHRSLYMSGNRTKESIIGFLKKVNRDACGRAGSGGADGQRERAAGFGKWPFDRRDRKSTRLNSSQ